MILSIGTDILHIPRIRSLISRRGAETLARRILCEREWREFMGKGVGNKDDESGASVVGKAKDGEEALRYLSNRWVVKEAAYKSLSLHFPRLTWKHLDLTTITRLSSVPSLGFTSAFRSQGSSGEGIKKRDVKLHVSISHDGDYVVGFVVAERVSDNVSDEGMDNNDAKL